MAVIENRTQIYALSGRRTVILPNGSKTETPYSVGSSVWEQLNRTGTGRRRKPSTPDNTVYTREQKSFVNFRGVMETETISGPSRGRKEIHTGPCPIPSVWQQHRLAVKGSTLSDYAQVAKVRALKRLDQRDMDLGTAWAERGKTVNLVRTVAETGVEALRAIKRGSGRDLLRVFGLDDARAAGEGFVNTNLTYHYGMKPLLQDVAGAAQALSRLAPETWAVRTKGTYQNAVQRRFTAVVDNVTRGLPLEISQSYLASVHVSVSARQKPLSRADDARWALGLDNPLATGWELVPYSFVADWMFGVGDWLQALNTLKYYDRWEIVTSSLQKDDLLLTGSSSETSLYSNRSSGQGSSKELYLYRTMSSNPIVGLPIKDPRSLWHMANALSLLAAASYGKDYRPMIRY